MPDKIAELEKENLTNAKMSLARKAMKQKSLGSFSSDELDKILHTPPTGEKK